MGAFLGSTWAVVVGVELYVRVESDVGEVGGCGDVLMRDEEGAFELGGGLTGGWGGESVGNLREMLATSYSTGGGRRATRYCRF